MLELPSLAATAVPAVVKDDEINWYINNLDETHAVQAVIDDYFGIIHNDDDEPKFIKFFQDIVVSHPNDFEDKPLQEKVNLLFECYVRKALPYVYATPSFQKAAQALSKKIDGLCTKARFTSQETIYSICRNRVYEARCIFISHAIATFFKVSYIGLNPDPKYPLPIVLSASDDLNPVFVEGQKILEIPDPL